jgi:hypothetical protein
MELGRSGRPLMMMLRPPAAQSYGVIAKHAALKERQFIGDPLALDRLAPPAGRRRRFHFSEIRFGANDGARAFGANDRSCGRRRAH